VHSSINWSVTHGRATTPVKAGNALFAHYPISVSEPESLNTQQFLSWGIDTFYRASYGAHLMYPDISAGRVIFFGALRGQRALEQGLECQNAFAKVYLPSNTDAKKRHAVTPANMAKINKECVALDDDIRWLVAIIFDTGMRLSEAAGLMLSDLHLDAETPHIQLVPHPHRRLKTASSERKIPLIGLSLWAAKRLKQHSTGLYCFPRYTNPERCNSNSASAAINKWIKTVAGPNDVVHGLRHSFRDRLRAVEAPTDMIDQLGGWALKSVGQGYGDGYDLELLVKYLGRLAIDRKIKNISLPTSI
jgi:integrase